jgi:hypothetical protein
MWHDKVMARPLSGRRISANPLHSPERVRHYLDVLLTDARGRPAGRPRQKFRARQFAALDDIGVPRSFMWRGDALGAWHGPVNYTYVERRSMAVSFLDLMNRFHAGRVPAPPAPMLNRTKRYYLNQGYTWAQVEGHPDYNDNAQLQLLVTTPNVGAPGNTETLLT